jgi:putative nucleotidyltransferase with HDIG domain
MDQRENGLVDAARKSLPIIVHLQDSYDAEGVLERDLGFFLREAGQAEAIAAIYYCVRELVGNAVKANAKRAFFAEKKLSLADPHDYEKGMAAFHKAYKEHPSELNHRAAGTGLWVRAYLRLDGDVFICTIRNNAILAEEEKQRISERLRQARAFSSFEEALAAMDSTEGAGLGLIILSLTLRKFGLSPDAFSIVSEGGETIARLAIPSEGERKAYLEDLSVKMVRYIDALPAMPGNLTSLLDALNGDDVALSDIADRIAVDPSLAAYVLKVSNSAAYNLIRKVNTIREAVTIIGTRGLKYILLQYGVTTILGRLPSGAEELWQHSNKVAFYACYLARQRNQALSLVDDALVIGLLHDMGKIVQYTVNSRFMKEIETICEKGGIPPSLLENVMTGFNHARIGGLLARKWNFPEVLTQGIEYHHRPWAAAPEYRLVTSLVYLANCLCEEDRETITYDQIDSDIMAENGIRDSGDLDAVCERIAKAFSCAGGKRNKGN